MKHIYIIGILLFCCCSCSSFLEEYSQDLARVENVTDLDELLLGSAYYNPGRRLSEYPYMEGEVFNCYIHFMSDELMQNSWMSTGKTVSVDLLFGYYTWQRNVGIDVNGTNVSSEDDVWKATYQYINATNMIIGELDEVSPADEEEAMEKIRIEGEAHFLRALYYFTLVNLYAEPYTPSTAAATQGIPLKLTSYIEDKNYFPGSVAEVYRQITDDLAVAETCLAQTSRKSVYRADITATWLLMSRVYLYMQDYPNAQKYAQKAYERNHALTDLKNFLGEDNVFTSSSPEVIFSMGGHFLSNLMYGDNWGDYDCCFYVSEDLSNAFTDDDLRKSKYIVECGYGYLFKKIYWGYEHDGAACTVSDNFLFRTSEIYLNLAEAAVFNNDEATALSMLKELRNNRFVNAPEITASGDELITFIREERQRELCLEGHRWFDLRRYAVTPRNPWSASYRHTWSEWNYSTLKRQRTYELKANDAAYTLAYPKDVIDFQNNISVNKRPDRQPVSSNQD